MIDYLLNPVHGLLGLRRGARIRRRLTENLSLFNGFDMLGSASGGFAVAEGNYAVTGQGTVLISEHGDSLH